MSTEWKWAITVSVIIAIIYALNVYAGAISEANGYRDQVEALQDTLLLANADTVRLSAELRAVDEANAVSAKRDSALIRILETRNAALGADLDSLRATERKSVEGLEGALSVLATRLGPEDLPYLRHVVDAQEIVFSTLRDQLAVKDDEIANRIEEIGIVRLALNGAVEGRRAADAFADGLRAQVQVQAQVIETQELEIGSLRSAVVPGFFLRIKQNLELIGLTATVTTLIVLAVR